MPSIVWPDNLNAILLIAVDVLAVTVLLYNFILVLRGRRAMHVLSGLSVLLLLYGASVWLGLRLLRAILEGFAPFSPVAFIVLFQSELRGYLTRLGRIRWFRANWLKIGRAHV